jgi:hypothetical protein
MGQAECLSSLPKTWGKRPLERSKIGSLIRLWCLPSSGNCEGFTRIDRPLLHARYSASPSTRKRGRSAGAGSTDRAPIGRTMTGMPQQDDSRPAAAITAVEPPSGPQPPQQPVTRPRGKPFQPGNKAGAKGRPRTDQRLRAALNRWSLEAARCLRDLMRDPKTHRETKRKIAEYIVDRKLGRPTTSIAGADNAPLFPGAPAADSPLAALIERIRNRKAAAASAGAPEASSSTQPENAAPGASGAEPGLPS